MGKKGGGKMPAAPDPYQTAQAQGQMNKETAIANAYLNRINQYTPEGSIEFKQTGTNPDGTPQFASYQQYSPGQQQMYENELATSNALQGLALQNVNRVGEAQNKPFDYSGMTPLQTDINRGNINTGYESGGDIQKSLDFSNLSAIPGIGDYGAEAKRVQDAVYNQATSRLDPQWEQQQRQLASTLAGKGVSENSEAYRRAMDQFSRNRTDAYNQATYSGIQAGGQEQSRLFGLALSGRQQGVNEASMQGEFGNAAQQQAEQQNMQRAGFGNTAQQQGFNQNQAAAAFNNQGRQQQIQEATYLRNLPLNEISALMGAAGGVSQPQFGEYSPVAQQGVDYAGMVQNQYANQMEQYKIKQQQKAAGLGSIFGTIGQIGGALISDRRMKHNIKRVGELINGIPTYVFSYLGSNMREFGVMAQEVVSVMPHAVHVNDNGYMMVDYKEVYGGC